MLETEKALQEYDVLIQGYEEDLESERYDELVKQEFRFQRDLFLAGRQALSEKLEREQGCEYCTGKKQVVSLMTISEDRSEPKYVNRNFANTYCPNCGRKVVKE